MNPNTNHLMALPEDMVAPAGYIPLPEELEHAAKVKLAGKSEATVSKNSGGKLSNWAKDKRKKKSSKVSQRKNRK